MSERTSSMGIISDWTSGTCRLGAVATLLFSQVTACVGQEGDSIAADIASPDPLDHAVTLVGDYLSTLESAEQCKGTQGYCGVGAAWLFDEPSVGRIDLDLSAVSSSLGQVEDRGSIPTFSESQGLRSFGRSQLCEMAPLVDGVRYLMFGLTLRGALGVGAEVGFENIWDLQNNEFFVRGKTALGMQVGAEFTSSLEVGLARQVEPTRSIERDMLAPRVQGGVVLSGQVGGRLKVFDTDTGAHGVWFGLTEGLAAGVHVDRSYSQPMTELGLGQLYMQAGYQPSPGKYSLRECDSTARQNLYPGQPCKVVRFAGRGDLLLSMMQTVTTNPTSKLALAIVTAMGAQELYAQTGQRLSALCEE